jgi:hypothetical protein
MHGEDHSIEVTQTQFVEVFTTNVDNVELSAVIQGYLVSMFEGSRVSFDLEDIDCVLRIASPSEINPDAVVKVLSTFGFQARVMPETEVHDL